MVIIYTVRNHRSTHVYMQVVTSYGSPPACSRRNADSAPAAGNGACRGVRSRSLLAVACWRSLPLDSWYSSRQPDTVHMHTCIQHNYVLNLGTCTPNKYMHYMYVHEKTHDLQAGMTLRNVCFGLIYTCKCRIRITDMTRICHKSSQSTTIWNYLRQKGAYPRHFQARIKHDSHWQAHEDEYWRKFTKWQLSYLKHVTK